jgi:hypothetical protein
MHRLFCLTLLLVVPSLTFDEDGGDTRITYVNTDHQMTANTMHAWKLAVEKLVASALSLEPGCVVATVTIPSLQHFNKSESSALVRVDSSILSATENGGILEEAVRRIDSSSFYSVQLFQTKDIATISGSNLQLISGTKFDYTLSTVCGHQPGAAHIEAAITTLAFNQELGTEIIEQQGIADSPSAFYQIGYAFVAFSTFYAINLLAPFDNSINKRVFHCLPPTQLSRRYTGFSKYQINFSVSGVDLAPGHRADADRKLI